MSDVGCFVCLLSVQEVQEVQEVREVRETLPKKQEGLNLKDPTLNG
jgi:hypothetical protein